MGEFRESFTDLRIETLVQVHLLVPYLCVVVAELGNRFSQSNRAVSESVASFLHQLDVEVAEDHEHVVHLFGLLRVSLTQRLLTSGSMKYFESFLS